MRLSYCLYYTIRLAGLKPTAGFLKMLSTGGALHDNGTIHSRERTMELAIALGLVFLLGGWVCFLKKQVSDLADRVAIMESERESRGARGKRGEAGEEKAAGIATFTIE